MAKQKAPRGTGSIYWDPHGERYVGRIQVDGRRRSVYARTKTEAREKLNALLRDGYQPRGGGSRQLGALLAEWLERDAAGRGLAPSTLNRHQWAVDRLDATLGDVRLDELDVGKIDDALDQLAANGEGLSKWSLRAIRSTLRQALNYASRRGEIKRNPAEFALIPAKAQAEVKRRSLLPEEAAVMFDAFAEERNGVMFDLMLRCGLRPGEAAGIWWKDLDLDAPIANVTRAVRRDGGRSAVSDYLKTSKAKRTIGLPAETVERLIAHRREQAAERLAAPVWGDERLVFATPAGGVLDASKIRKQLAAICTAAEIDVTRPNELRHTCASYLIEQGVPVSAVAALLGHSSTRMVEQTYHHRLREVMDTATTVEWPTLKAPENAD